jgi:hypothetical protein
MMRINKFAGKIIYVTTCVLLFAGCGEKIEEDPCLKTKWPQAKEFEIKLAVHVMPSNPLFPGVIPGSQDPVDFVKMVVNGTIEKVNCSGQKSGTANLGNSYITKDTDMPAPINVPEAYWIGYVVYVYELENDKDHMNINLTVKVTMNDNQSYVCNLSEEAALPQIVKVPGEMYYYILLDIYSTNWVKV